MTEVQKKRGLFQNFMSWIGMIIALVALGHIIFFVIAEQSQAHTNPYVGILAYMVLPAVLVFGLAVMMLGAWRERRRRARARPDEIPLFPRIDLNLQKHRRWLVFSVVAGTVFILISTIGSYQAYHYTDSNEFCGLLCHSVMHPEYTAYQLSPHARVGCVDCHVGPGAGWYVRSKLSGAYQVYSVIFKKYPKPIHTPIENLRPSQETCEQCHWPEKFWGAQLKTFQHFASDEQNTPRETRLLIKTGGGSATTGGATAGIHTHMNIENEITFIASDKRREVIPWVRVRNRLTGEVTDYIARDAQLTPEQIAAAPKRQMECVDCHNRPTHIYVAPDTAVDRALGSNVIDRTLPFIKSQAVAALVKDYPSSQQALGGIARHLREYYTAQHPEIAATRSAQIEQAIKATQTIYSSTIFPEMKVDWRTHPDHIGHFYYNGCFRCHDDNHVSADGKVVSKDCNICHEVLSQSENGEAIDVAAGFQHPVELGDLREFNCADCHNGGAME
jgi:nitrate/TMAO reductase-like tetraheme cytochrome c subunit